MTSNLPKDAGNLFHKGAKYTFEDATFYAYGVGITTEMVQQACDQAAASYLRHGLNWLHISMDKPQFFTVGSAGQFELLSDCINLYVERLRLTLDATDATHSNKSLPMYPHGFIIVQDANRAMLALACKNFVLFPTMSNYVKRFRTYEGETRQPKTLSSGIRIFKKYGTG
ncbi:hypothetical protein FCULG_00009241 [Fusarium culmorum]|uniref:Uncharacterized protein n=1 Tax=Fusarium culmorum TaxID=5516 RepID=A0A2T4GH87_FUSCU|nr:hypothetical protein FCULG_00009241 [Fusarium culmorum]